jgi:(2Fe-2S) ferredoxin
LFIARNTTLGRIEASAYDALWEVDVLTSDLAPVRENVYFVCTNGQRDLCCARYGLPTFARLQELVGARVWQTTHLGGHRFAPNVLALPQGILYGRVDVDEVDAFVTTIESGDVSRSHVRGRSAFPPEAQFAEMQVAGRVEALLDIRDDRVRFRTNLGEEEIRVRSASIPMQIVASCGDAESKDVYPISGTA